MGKMECRVAKEVSLARLIRLISQLLPRNVTSVFIPTNRLVDFGHILRNHFMKTKFTKHIMEIADSIHNSALALLCDEFQLPTGRAE